MTTLEDAYRECAAITKAQARNFYYGIRLLPGSKRSVLCAVYALARRIDDIGDGDLPTEQKVSALAELRRSLGSMDASSDPVLVAVADAARQFPIPLGAFVEIVDGVEMDVTGRSYATFDELVVYCRCVAGSVGRLCLGVFGDAREPNRNHGGGKADPKASAYADALGIALQQTNILRDIREDLGNGRVYLPQSDLNRFGVELKLDERGDLVDKDGELAALISFSAERARRWYTDGLRLMPLLDRRSAACCGAMAGIYSRLLTRIAADPTAVYGRRMSLSGREKAAVAARALIGPGRAQGSVLWGGRQGVGG
jgi:15-cis-phytoene synthase